jgi:serine/threonine-protein kinase
MFRKLGPYRIEKRIGRGGMGTVYAGVHEETGERAAIKVLSATTADETNFRERFKVEIATLKHLRHPNIVQLLGEGIQDGQLYYVMELVDGSSLQDELQSGRRFTWQEVANITIQVCQALKHAHDHGVIHRDLKPANLLVTPEGHVKLTDFGIAKLFGASQLTADGSVVGTADFMAPEQAERRPTTPRTDLFSLGTVMFTLLARRPPFAGDSLPQVVHKLCYEPPPPIRRYAPTVPIEMELIIEQLLRKDPQERIATALALANRLRAMEHALQVRSENGTSVAPSTKSPPAPPIDPDQPTRMSHEERGPGDKGPRTEIPPTMADASGSREQAASPSKFSWNEATAVTPSRVPQPTAASAAPGTPGAQTGDRTEPEPEPPEEDRFSRVSDPYGEDARGRHGWTWRTGLEVAALAIALVLVVMVIIPIMRPPTADEVYSRIERSKHDLSLVSREIERFLDDFPEDPRRAEVEGYALDVASQQAKNRVQFHRRPPARTPVEQLFLDGMVLKEDGQLESACETFLKMLDELPEPSAETAEATAAEQDPDLRRLGEHQVRRISEELRK